MTVITLVGPGGATDQERGLEVIAHRCNSSLEIEKAISNNPDHIELDVRRTKDDQIIVFHDNEIDGTGVEELTVSEIQEIDSEIPTLDQILEKKSDIIIQIDAKIDKKCLKVRASVKPEELISTLKKYGAIERVIVTSADYDFLKKARAVSSEIKLGYDPYYEMRMNTRLYGLPNFLAKNLIARCKEINVKALYVSKEGLFRLKRHGLINSFIRTLHKNEIKIIAWIVDDETKVKELLAMGVDGMTTNKPELYSLIKTGYGGIVGEVV